MRTLLAAVCGGRVALTVPRTDAAPTWAADSDAIRLALDDASERVVLVSNTRALAATADGGVWATTGERLLRLSADAAVRADIDLDAEGYGRGLALAVDPFDDSAWMTTDAALLLHFDRDGSLVTGMTLAAAADALAVALDQAPWVLAGGHLLHFSPIGASLALSGYDAAGAGSIRWAVDALRDRIWIADSHGLRRIGPAGNGLSILANVRPGPMHAMTLDPRTGDLWFIVDGSLTAIDPEGATLREFALPAMRDGEPAALYYDAVRDAIVLRTRADYTMLSRDGRILEE